MKKIFKGMLVLTVGLLLTGCGNNNNTDESTKIEQPAENENNIFDVSSDKVNLYQESVKSVVRIEAGNQIGSGVVYKKESGLAYIITNAHVITDKTGNDYSNDIEVIFHDFSKVKGTFIGLDKNKDVAVISIADNSSCTVAKIVERDNQVVVGESVYAIGNPFGEYFSVTDGVISNNRWKTTTDYISGTTETKTFVYNATATINSGNSGGPLFNSKGEVISINTMQPADSSMRNFNYSIPVNYFIKVANHIVKNKTSYVDPKIAIEGKSVCGFSVENLTTLGVTVKNGVYVTKSSEMGINQGRIITKVNGNVVETFEDYEFELLKYNVGETITIVTTDIIGSNERTVNIVLR